MRHLTMLAMSGSPRRRVVRRLNIAVAVAALVPETQRRQMRRPQAVHLVVNLACAGAADGLLGVGALWRGVGGRVCRPP